jgi:hypothetical protein
MLLDKPRQWHMAQLTSLVQRPTRSGRCGPRLARTGVTRRDEAGRLECQWQRAQLPAEIRELVLDDQRQRNEAYWSLFEG